jgi:poly-gamma-glutamate synthesis protein (capsule biosynthesis protein)
MKIRRWGTLLIMLAGLLLCLSACQSKTASIPVQSAYSVNKDSHVNLTLIAVGDNLIHGPIYRQANERSNNSGFDFRPAYQQIASYLAEADLALMNQETPLGGTELGLSSYPQFNSPQELGEQMIELGFNMFSHANNHVLDAGQRGFNNTIAFWRRQSAEKPVIMAGIAADREDDQLQILQVKDLKIALLAYTYGTNGLRLPKSSSGIIKYLDDDLICQELDKAIAEANIVIVSVHWGQEYQANANNEQKRLAQLMADNGADIIIGSHPHVLQGVEMLSTPDGKQVPVFYSLGNFISAQNRPDTMLGGMAKVQMVYDKATGKLSLTELGIIPLVTDYSASYKNITIYPLNSYTEAQANRHGVRASNSSFSLAYLKKLFNQRVPEEYQIWN